MWSWLTLSNAISVSDVRYRASQDGDIPATYPGHQTNKSGVHKVYIDNIKYRSHQNVVWFEDDISAAPNIPFDGRAGISITGSITQRFTDSWEGYGVGTGWAKFRAPYSGQYSLAVEKLDGAPTTLTDLSGNPLNGFVPNVELWLPFTNDTPTSYADIEDFPAFAWPYDPPDVFNLIAGRTYYILVYGFHFGPGLGVTPIEEDGSFVINLQPFVADNIITTLYNGFSQASFIWQPRMWGSGQNVNATKETSEPTHPDGSGKTVWFLYQPVHTEQVTFRIERQWNAEFVISVYTGSSVSGLTLVTRSTDSPASVTFNATQFTNYRIQVDSKDGQEGGFILEWEMPNPLGNEFDNAIDLGNSTSVTRNSETTHGADGDLVDTPYGENAISIWADNDFSSIWYKWIAPSDGWVTITTTRISGNSVVHPMAFNGNDYSNIIKVVESSAFTSPQSISWPVKQGKEYRIRYSSGDAGQIYNFVLAHDAASTPANFSATSEFTADSEGEFTRFEIYPSGSKYANKCTYITWKMKYGDANKIEMDGQDASILFGRILDAAGTERLTLELNGSARSWRLGDNVVHANGTVEGSHVTQDWIRVELFVWPERGHYALYVNGRYCNTDSYPGTNMRYLDLGFIDDRASVPRPVILNYKDVYIRDVWNREFDYKPVVEPGQTHHVKNFMGFEHGLPRTGGTGREDWSGYRGDAPSTFTRGIAIPLWDVIGTPENTSRGRAIRLDIGQSVITNNAGITGYGTGNPVHAFGAWMYFYNFNGASETTGTILVSVSGDANDPVLRVWPDGNLSVRSALGDNNTQFLKRRLDTGRWHYLEIVYDERWPTAYWYVYLNEELIYEGIVDKWNRNSSPPNRGAPRIYGVGTGGGAASATLITDMVYGMGYEGKLGPYKTSLIVPNQSVDLVHLNSAGVGWWKSEDDGLNATVLTLGDNPHTYINTWPIIRNFEGTPAPIKLIAQDFTFNTGALSYVEVGFESMPGGEIPVAIKTLEAYRGWDKPLINDYEVESASDADLLLGVEIVSGGKEQRGQRYLTGEKDGTKAGITTISQENVFPFDHGDTPWTESSVNAVTVRWGFGGGGFAGAGDFGGVLQGLAIEVLMRDTYPSLAPYSILYAPNIEWNNPWYGGDFIADDHLNPTNAMTLNGCDAFNKRPLGTFPTGYPSASRFETNAIDPYIRNKVWWWIAISPFDHPRPDLETYWRVLPAYDSNYPGWDGDFHDTDIDRANGTTSYDMLVRWTKPAGYDWYDIGDIASHPDYPPHTTIRKGLPTNVETTTYGYAWLEAPTFLYEPCLDVMKGKLFPDRTFKIQAYVRDPWGNVSPTREITLNVLKGVCSCGEIVVPIKYRAKQDGDV